MESLRDELRHEREEHAEESRRKDHLLAALMQRVPELEASSQEPSDNRESVRPDAEAPHIYPDAEGRDTVSYRPWWRRIFDQRAKGSEAKTDTRTGAQGRGVVGPG